MFHLNHFMYSIPEILLTNFGERRHKDPEGDDERNLHSLKLHMEDMIGWSPPMVVMHRGVVTKIKMVLSRQHKSAQDHYDYHLGEHKTDCSQGSVVYSRFWCDRVTHSSCMMTW